jgi:hypothetical protein
LLFFVNKKQTEKLSLYVDLFPLLFLFLIFYRSFPFFLYSSNNPVTTP